MHRLSLIPPLVNDYLTDAVIDGVLALQREGSVDCRFPDGAYPGRFKLSPYQLPEDKFINFARQSDLVLLFGHPVSLNRKLVERIGVWGKTVFIDGGEVGKNNRFDAKVMADVVAGTHLGKGLIYFDMLAKCALYFRREKPYVKDIVPLPFAIETDFIKYRSGLAKDIDFVCVFGQEDYPPLRRQVREYLETFCQSKKFSCVTKPTRFLFFNIHSNLAKARFRRTLARAKVGISVGGGGFDTMRFWEILANNCLLLTERVDIFRPEDQALTFSRIWQFSDLEGFKSQLQRVADFLRAGYRHLNLAPEYQQILDAHSSVARVNFILDEAKHKGIIK